MSIHLYTQPLFYARQWPTEVTEVPKLVGSDTDYWTNPASSVTEGQTFALSYKYVETVSAAYAFTSSGVVIPVLCGTPDNTGSTSVITIESVQAGTIGPLIVSYRIPANVIDAYGNARAMLAASGKFLQVHIGSADPIAVINALHAGINAIEQWLEISPTPWSGGVFTEQISFTPNIVPKLSTIYAGHINEIAQAVMKLYRQVWALKAVLPVPVYADLEPRDILTLFGNGSKPGLGDLVCALRRLDNLLASIQKWEW